MDPIGAVDHIVTVYLLFESEMLHHIEYLTERIENLGHGRYLPVKMPVVETYGKNIRLVFLARIELCAKSVAGKLEPGTVEPEVFCCVHKLHKMWNVKRGLLEELNAERLEARGGDLTDNRFQVSATTLERKPAKVVKSYVS
jgi:hypothetical protein